MSSRKAILLPKSKRLLKIGFFKRTDETVVSFWKRKAIKGHPFLVKLSKNAKNQDCFSISKVMTFELFP